MIKNSRNSKLKTQNSRFCDPWPPPPNIHFYLDTTSIKLEG